MFEVTVDRLTMPQHVVQQIWRVRRGNPLGGEMPTNVEISRIFSLFDRLVLRPRGPESLLLPSRFFVSGAVLRFALLSNAGNVFLRCGQFVLSCAQLLFRLSPRFHTSFESAHEF